jgi:hypothetical protein
MSRCPNCGQSSESDFCEWCGYPVHVGGQIDKEKAKREAKEARKARQAEQEAKKKADLEARKKAKREAKEAKKARQAEQEARKKADLEAKEKAKREAKKAKKARQAEQEAKKKADLEAREKAKREAKKARQAEQEARKKADLEAREKAEREAKDTRQAHQRAKKNIKATKDLVTESKVNTTYEGIVRIVLPQANLNQVKIVEQYLLQIQNIRLLLAGGSVEAGSEFIVSADKPVPLTSFLERIEFLEGVVAKGNCIQLTMRL